MLSAYFASGIVTCWDGSLVCDAFLCFVMFPHGVLGHVVFDCMYL